VTDHTFNAAQPTPELQLVQWLQGYLGCITGRDELSAFEANTIRSKLAETVAAQPPAAPVEMIETGPVTVNEWEDARSSAGNEHVAMLKDALRAAREELIKHDQEYHHLTDPKVSRLVFDAILSEPQGTPTTHPDDCDCIGAVIGQHERSCPQFASSMTRPHLSGEK
jgi:hypothetical protein